MISDMNTYLRAAEYLKSYAAAENIEIPSAAPVEAARAEFLRRYAPEILEKLDDDHILPYIFYTAGDNKDALCCFMEMNKACKEYLGSIAGGYAYKYGLFQRKDTGVWVKGAAAKPENLTEEQALKEGKKIRDALVEGAKTIREMSPENLEDYERLDERLTEVFRGVDENFSGRSWVQKYYAILFPDKVCGFFSSEWHYHILRALQISPSKTVYGRNGQIALIQNAAGWNTYQFGEVFTRRFGKSVRFYRLGTSTGDGESYASDWEKKGVIGLGWSDLGDLRDYASSDGKMNTDALKNAMKPLYPDNESMASRKTTEVQRFYEAGTDTVFVLMNGLKLIAMADHPGEYTYDPSMSMPHLRPAEWKHVFEEGEHLPVANEGKFTSCVEFKKEENLRFLYARYYGTEELTGETDRSVDPPKTPPVVLADPFRTGLCTPFERNRILFGAPGTGKSYTLNKEREVLLGADNEEDYERVTFHPDYSYAQFVGTYKPVPKIDGEGHDTITYKYVPGPFMRMYVKAMRSALNGEKKPFLLVVEEINRANVAAVFGDVFQLLDRDEYGVSEYPIQASEDVKAYLAAELNGNPEDYAKIRIPDNLFLWATMNSADQGVFPMDTAFKRRWDFTYLGIDEGEEKIRGKYVRLAGGTQRVEWNRLRKAINAFLADEKINEDKQLGPFFLSRSIAAPENSDEIDADAFARVFKNKVLMYLFEDAAKQKRMKLFEGCGSHAARYSEICRMFDAVGVEIFTPSIQNALEKTAPDHASPDGDEG